MNGRPVWLASVSQWNGTKIIPTSRWGSGVRNAGLKTARRVLGPLGDESMERAFLMCATLCYHRGASDAEIAELPEGPGGLAGPPFDQVIFETSECPPAGLSFTPCDRRRFHTIRRNGAELKMPIDDCGECPSCEARSLAMTGTVA